MKDISFSFFLKRLFCYKRNLLKKRFNRVLPSNELFTDRWEKAKYLKFGMGSSIYDSSLVFGDVKVGESTWIGPFTIIDGTAGLEIGSHCAISSGVHIYTHDASKHTVTGGKVPFEYAPVKIGNYCYIGPNTVITKGVEIGSNCIIGANSFVNKSFPDYSKLAGNPAKIID